MTDTALIPILRETHSDWVRLRTLTLLRWLAIGGQLIAILVAALVYQLQIPVAGCLLVVSLSVGFNLLIEYIFPQNTRLGETQALLLLVFDMAQLTLLLFLTGGLNNPFVILILAPVTISASVLELRSAVIVGLLGIGLVSVLVPFNLPLRALDGRVLEAPALLQDGFWLSIVIAILFLGAYSRRVATEIRTMSDAVMAAQMALAREQKLTDLGGVVAAAAHELGTPLATVKLVSTEMIAELQGQPDLQDDARLIRDQADRCREILRSMGQAGKDDLHLRQAPLIAVLREACAPHLDRGKRVSIALGGPGGGPRGGPGGGDERQPLIARRPEIIHGLRNLVQNAVDFAAGNVWIEAHWNPEAIVVVVADDGPGFPQHLIGRIGDPFLRARRPMVGQPGDPAADPPGRPGYEGMGLGLFIAKTLLERTGAVIDFRNAAQGGAARRADVPPEWTGAIVSLTWPRGGIEAAAEGGLGENRLIET